MPQSVQKAKGTKLFLALLATGIREKPTSQTLTVDAATPGTPIAKNATTIPLAAGIDGKIPKGQYFLFIDGDGVERLAQLSADAPDGATSLTVYALPEPIADASTAIYPVKIQARSAASVSRSASLQSTITFDTGSERDGTTTSKERSLSAGGNYLHFDAGLRTAEYAFENDLEVWLIRELPAPTAAYSKGKVTEGPAAITSLPDEAPADNFITQSFEAAFLGTCIETQPKPVT